MLRMLRVSSLRAVTANPTLGEVDAMKSRIVSGRAFAEVVAMIGAVAGLAFVGIEIRNNTAVARAETRREVAAQNIDMLMRLAENEHLAQLWSEEWTSEFMDSLSPADRTRMGFTGIALILRLESTYLQHKEGLIDEEALLAYGFTQPKVTENWFRGFWEFFKDGFLDPDFVAYMESENPELTAPRSSP